ncbi:MAG: threonine/serine exporter family protein [Xanthomonadales bacterium]|nr:threonine/serine exporter family protein [Xanthomonadales bacterium]
MVRRVRFIVEMARSLHRYGTPAPRLENAVSQVADTIGLVCNINSNPTSLLFSFREQGGPETVLEEVTRVVRLEPGGLDLKRLTLADAVVESVLAGALDVDDGYARLLEIEAMSGMDGRLVLAAYGLIGAALAVLLARGWADVLAAGAISLVVGVVAEACARRPNLAPSTEAVCALVATVLAYGVSELVQPLSVQTVVLSSLIVLLPGLALTTAINELATQHLVSGVARFAGAFAVLLKLTFGVVAGTQVCHLMGWTTAASDVAAVPGWVLWPALAGAAFGFAVSFRAAWRDFPLVMAAAIGSYLLTRWFGSSIGNGAGVFIAALVACAAGNLYARLWRRPGALIRLPGIILLVPGSVGFRSLTHAFERDIFLSLDTGFTLLSILITLVAGLLFGNLLVPPRRSL